MKLPEGEWIKCPKCNGVNSITYDPGCFPRACSTCNAFGSIFIRTPISEKPIPKTTYSINDTYEHSTYC